MRPDEGETHDGLRVGIAGAGFIGAVHARAARLARARLVGVAASTLEGAESAARRLGAERAFPSAEALAESPDVDVVHVCTPNHLHLPLAEAALAAGKHVICEKPLALDLAGAARLTELAAASGALRVRAVRLSLPPDGARGARARARRPHGRGASRPRLVPAGLAGTARGRQLARGRGPRRRVARVRRHRVALV